MSYTTEQLAKAIFMINERRMGSEPTDLLTRDDLLDLISGLYEELRTERIAHTQTMEESLRALERIRRGMEHV